jgi:O-antigen/teichoic acid export membrane protein
MIDPDVPVEQPRGSFLGHVNVVMLTYVLDGALAFATGVLIARDLGADGRGAYSLFVLSAAFGQLLLGLGLGNAAIYFINRRELSLREVVAAAHVVTTLALVATAVAMAVIAPWAGDDLFGAGIPPWLLIAAVPALLYWNLMRLVLQAQSRFVDLAFATVVQQAILLSVIAALIAADELTPSRAAGCLAAATTAAGVLTLMRVGLRHVELGQIVRPRLGIIRKLAGFGVKGEAGNVLQLLNYRLDQYIVSAYVGLTGVGIYAVSASMTEAIFMFANAVALVLLPRLTANDDEAAWMAPLALRNTILIAGIGALVLAVVAPVLVPLAFGDEYDDSVQALWLLLPGTVALAGSKVLTSYIFSQGRPLVNTGITAVSLVVTLAADFAFIPWLDVNGAAIASSLAYSAHFVAALVAYRQLSGQSPFTALIPNRDDIRLYADAARTLRARVMRAQIADADRPREASH